MPTTTLTTSHWPSAWRSTSWLSSGESLPTSSRAITAGNRVWSSARRTSCTRCVPCLTFNFTNCEYRRCTAVNGSSHTVPSPVHAVSPCRMQCSTHQSPRTLSWQRSCWPGSYRKTRRSASLPACSPATTCCGQMLCWRPPGGTTSWTFQCHTSFRSWGSTSAR